MKASPILAATVVAGTTFAEQGTGPGTSTNASYFAEANRHPNSTRSILFQPWFQQTSEGVYAWRYEVNITDVATPSPANRTNRILNTAHSFVWPTEGQKFNGTNNGTLNQVAANITRVDPEHFCVTIIDGFSQNATNGWNPNAGNGGSCIPPLGNNCTQAMRRAWEMSTKKDSNGCKNLDPSQLPECMGNFGSYRAANMNLVDNGTQNSNTSSVEYVTFPLRSGNAFWYETADGNDKAAFDREDLKLRMLLIDSGDTYRALCTRVRYNESERNHGAVNSSSPHDVVLTSKVWFAGAAALGPILWLL